MNTKSMRGHGLSRLLAGFLCLLLLVGILPVSAFAASEGQQASSAYGDTVIGSDGQPYYSPSGYYTMTYHDDGSTSYVYHGGNVAYRHFVLNTDGGGFRWVYCIESGIRFGDSDDGYYSEQTDNSQYFNQLPEASRRGIMLASLYGWQPGASLPMAGINADDWYMAAQCIIWEYQPPRQWKCCGKYFLPHCAGTPCRAGLLLDSGADRFPFHYPFLCRDNRGKRPGA